jgi:hypothetical protein
MKRPVAKRIQRFSSQSATPDQLLLKLKRQKKSVNVVQLKSLVLLGHLKADRMLEFGAAYLRMSVAL